VCAEEAVIRCRTSLVAVALPTVLVGIIAAGPAGATPATVNLNHIDVAPPVGSGLAPIGRTTAGAVPNTPPKQVRVPPGLPGGPPGLLPHTTARPYGGDHYSTQEINGAIDGCTAAFATQSTAGDQYVISAGHCTHNDVTGAVNVSQVDGKFWYPYTTNVALPPTIGDTGHRSAFDATGDHAAIRANRAGALFRQVRTFTGAIYTLTAAGNPVQNESGAAVDGKSLRVNHGFVSYPGPLSVTYNTGRVIGNQAILQVDVRAEGCPQPGDSGGPLLAGMDAIGIITGTAQDEFTCWVYFDRVGSTLSAYGLFLAPAP
jgi:hypothetical protein